MPIGKRKRTASDSVAFEGKKNPFEELSSKVESLQKVIEEKMENQRTLILDKLGNLDKTEAEIKPSFNSVIFPGFLKKNTSNTGMAPIGRSFVLKHTFKNVSKFEEGKDHFSGNEDHFGVSWRLSILKKDQHLQTRLWCRKSLDVGNWAINTKFAPRVIGADGKITTREFSGVFGNANGNRNIKAKGLKLIAWEELEKNYLVEDKLAVEVHVEIREMTGVYKKNLRCFDETMKNVSDVVLIVGSQKFYVSRLYLATHSSYFKTLFLGNFQESNQSEIELSGICPEDFQNYLEVLYGDPAIDESTVEGILLVADMYDTSIVIGKCEEFLIEKSEKSIKKKLQMGIRYNSDRLKTHCLSEIETKEDIIAVLPGNPEDMDHSVTVKLLNKALHFL